MAKQKAQTKYIPEKQHLLNSIASLTDSLERLHKDKPESFKSWIRTQIEEKKQLLEKHYGQ
jgi:hypothetical protein